MTREQAPEIRGVRLGMSTEQLLTLFPEETNRQRITQAVKDSKRVDSYGVARFTLQPDTAAANPKMAGVNYIAVDVIDERVTSFHIEYAGIEWKR